MVNETEIRPVLTREDVAWLRRMQFTTLSHDEAEQHQTWYRSFLARLEALVPPNDHA